MTKTQRREKNQAQAAAMKAAGIERTVGRCPICNVLYRADFLGRGYAAHRCEGGRGGSAKARRS